VGPSKLLFGAGRLRGIERTRSRGRGASGEDSAKQLIDRG
jgi:hypothetical protein